MVSVNNQQAHLWSVFTLLRGPKIKTEIVKHTQSHPQFNLAAYSVAVELVITQGLQVLMFSTL